MAGLASQDSHNVKCHSAGSTSKRQKFTTCAAQASYDLPIFELGCSRTVLVTDVIAPQLLQALSGMQQCRIMSSALAAQTQCTRVSSWPSERVCAALLQASELLEQGKLKYSSGDRMGALKLFERVLQTEVSAVHPLPDAVVAGSC